VMHIPKFIEPDPQLAMAKMDETKFHVVEPQATSETKFHVVDSIMGSGKTQGAISYINAHPFNKFIVITPYLTEIKRFVEGCPVHKFREPERCEELNQNKSDSFESLLDKKENIVTTHVLFFMQSDNIYEKYRGYKLIIDETPEQAFRNVDNLTEAETRFLFNEFISLDENKYAIWKETAPPVGRFGDIKELADAGRLRGYIAEDTDKISKCLFEVFPSAVFEEFEEVVLLTYLLHGQIFSAYLETEKINYDYWYVKSQDGKYEFTEDFQPDSVYLYKDLINIYGVTEKGNDKLNRIGDGRYALSKSWYNEAKEETFNILSNNLINYFKNITFSKSEDRLWTTFLSYEGVAAKNRFRKNFITCNQRATNNYRKCSNLAYLTNRFMSPSYSIMFSRYGVSVDNEAFALAEMLQWIWRSAIRDDKSINIYIPSERMRNLLIGWLAFVARDECPENATSANIYEWIKTMEAKRLPLKK